MAVNKNKKTGKYYCSFYFTDWQGNRPRMKREGFDLKREAMAFEQDFLNRLAANCSITFENLYTYYIEDCKARLKARTLQNKQMLLKRHALPVFGKMPINDITPAMIRKWQNDILATHKATSARTIHIQLSSVFSFAVKYYGLKSNPVSIAGTIGTTKSGRLDFWTIDEFNQFIAAVKASPSKRGQQVNTETLVAAYTVLFYTGLRVGEFLALTLEDFDAEAHTLRINKTLAIIERKTIVNSPKTEKSIRTIFIPEKLCQLIKAEMSKLYQPEQTERIFPTLRDQQLRYHLNVITREAGLRPIRIHDFRHSHASMLIHMNCSPLLISERFGHENVQTTLGIYAHLYPNQAKEMAIQLNNFINT